MSFIAYIGDALIAHAETFEKVKAMAEADLKEDDDIVVICEIKARFQVRKALTLDEIK